MRFDRSATPQETIPPQRAGLPATLWRIPRYTRTDDAAKVRATLEDGPFYARSLVDTQLFGERTTAFHEQLSLDRFAAPWVRALLPFRMPRVVW